MVRPAAALLVALAALGALALLPGAAGHEEGPALRRVSFDPAAGDYTLIVAVHDFALVAPNASAPSLPGEGHVVYRLNGHPCAGLCAGELDGQDYRTNRTSFTFHRLVVGDEVGAELVGNDGTPLSPPVTLAATVRDKPVQCVEYAADGECLRVAPIGPLVAITSGIPNAGEYRMEVRVERFNVLPPGAAGDEVVDTGHLLYTRNGSPCVEGCSGGAEPATDAVAFTFRGVAVGDRLGVELVRPDGSSLMPRASAVVAVAQPAIRITSGVPQEGLYTMLVEVTGFNLAAPGSTQDPASGHVAYLVQRAGSRTWVAASTISGEDCRPAKSETASKTYRFCGLEEGDHVTAELVHSSGTRLDPRATAQALEVRRRPADDLFTPAVGPLAAVLVLALAAAWRRFR